jgi:hypothetical protein
MTRKYIPAIPASQCRDDGPDAVYLNPFAAKYPGIPLAATDRAARYVAACLRARAEEAAEAAADTTADDDAAALRDGIESGDRYGDGDPIPYPTYRSV